MVILVKLFGIVIVSMGIIFFIKPKALKQYLSFWKQEKMLKIGGVLTILLGIIFLIAASRCRLEWLIVVLGIWSIIKGVLLLTVAQKKACAYLDWWLAKPVLVIRFLGLFGVAFGILFIYAA